MIAFYGNLNKQKIIKANYLVKEKEENEEYKA